MLIFGINYTIYHLRIIINIKKFIKYNKSESNCWRFV